MLEERDVWATTNVPAYRGDVVSSDYYRKYFVKNDLTQRYTAFIFYSRKAN